ncbi:MAG: Sec-independent protein translocase subunit TatB [Campylobacter sp.]|nr:Sec-independent protein translocase subunit TatB [Campylobacter sp.]
MFGMSFTEILVIAIVAVIALGPEKLPKAMVEIAKYIKLLRKTIDDAKSTFDQEVRIAELKDDAKKYKDAITKTTDGVRKKLTFEELEDIKNDITNVQTNLNTGLSDIKKAVQNPTKLAKEKILNTEKNSQTRNKSKEDNDITTKEELKDGKSNEETKLTQGEKNTLDKLDKESQNV